MRVLNCCAVVVVVHKMEPTTTQNTREEHHIIPTRIYSTNLFFDGRWDRERVLRVHLVKEDTNTLWDVGGSRAPLVIGVYLVVLYHCCCAAGIQTHKQTRIESCVVCVHLGVWRSIWYRSCVWMDGSHRVLCCAWAREGTAPRTYIATVTRVTRTQQRSKLYPREASKSSVRVCVWKSP